MADPMPFTAEWLALYHKRKGKRFRLTFSSQYGIPKRLKVKRLHQQEETCCWCGHYMSMASATWEHIIPKADGGTDDFENLALAHYECNSKRDRNLAQQPHPSRKFDFIRAVLAKHKARQ
jgi:5-methylcytosine-specific restriction endonuclease McrA